MTRKQRIKNDAIQRMWQSISNMRLGQAVEPNKCQFCGKFHFGECETK